MLPFIFYLASWFLFHFPCSLSDQLLLNNPSYPFFGFLANLLLSLKYLGITICVLIMCVCVSCFVMSDSWQPHELWPARLLCPWDFPGKNTGMGCHFLPQGIFLTQGSNPGIKPRSPVLQADSLPSDPPRKPCSLVWVSS